MTSSRWEWRIPAALVAVSLVPAIAGIVRLTQLATGVAVTADNSRFFASPLPVVLHIPAVIIYSILGAFQFAPAFRRRRRGVAGSNPTVPIKGGNAYVASTSTLRA